MIDLSRHIEYLLLDRNHVCVQQLGTFNAKNMASRWVPEENIFLPPYRTITFDAQADLNDDTLLRTLASKYKISLQEAEILRAEFVERIQQELEESGTADLGSIGVFIRERADSEMLFIPAEAGVTTPSLYGLDAIHFEPLPVKHVPGKKQKKANGKASIQADDNYFVIRIHKRVVHYATAVAASVLLFFAFASPVAETAMTEQQMADTNFFLPSHLWNGNSLTPTPSSVEKGEESASTDASSSIDKGQSEANEAEVNEAEEMQPQETLQLEPQETAQVQSPLPTEEKLQKEVQADAPYAVVLASAIGQKRAEAYAAELQKRGYKAEVRTFDKMVRVIIPGFSTIDEAHAQINLMKAQSNEFNGIWTLKL